MTVLADGKTNGGGIVWPYMMANGAWITTNKEAAAYILRQKGYSI